MLVTAPRNAHGTIIKIDFSPIKSLPLTTLRLILRANDQCNKGKLLFYGTPCPDRSTMAEKRGDTVSSLDQKVSTMRAHFATHAQCLQLF